MIRWKIRSVAALAAATLLYAAPPARSASGSGEPVSLAALPGDRSVSLAWHGEDGEPAWGYHVYRFPGGLAGVPERANLLPLPGGPGGRFTDDGLENGGTYGYRVAAIDREGRERWLPAVAFARPAFLPGDVDGQADADGTRRVDGLDLIRVLAAFGRGAGEPGFDPAADLDGDGRVDGADLEITARHFGSRRRPAEQTGGTR